MGSAGGQQSGGAGTERSLVATAHHTRAARLETLAASWHDVQPCMLCCACCPCCASYLVCEEPLAGAAHGDDSAAHLWHTHHLVLGNHCRWSGGKGSSSAVPQLKLSPPCRTRPAAWLPFSSTEAVLGSSSPAPFVLAGGCRKIWRLPPDIATKKMVGGPGRLCKEGGRRRVVVCVCHNTETVLIGGAAICICGKAVQGTAHQGRLPDWRWRRRGGGAVRRRRR